MLDLKKVFIALPHVERVWVTTNGHFHLHSANGGDVVERADALDESVDTDAKEKKNVKPKK